MALAEVVAEGSLLWSYAFSNRLSLSLIVFIKSILRQVGRTKSFNFEHAF